MPELLSLWNLEGTFLLYSVNCLKYEPFALNSNILLKQVRINPLKPNGSTCTTCFNIENSTFCLQSVFFVVVSYGSHNKHLSSCALSSWSSWRRLNVFLVLYEPNLYILFIRNSRKTQFQGPYIKLVFQIFLMFSLSRISYLKDGWAKPDSILPGWCSFTQNKISLTSLMALHSNPLYTFYPSVPPLLSLYLLLKGLNVPITTTFLSSFSVSCTEPPKLKNECVSFLKQK